MQKISDYFRPVASEERIAGRRSMLDENFMHVTRYLVVDGETLESEVAQRDSSFGTAV